MIAVARLLLGGASVLALVLSAAAHLAAVDGIDVEAGYPQVWWLHAVAIALCAGAILFALRLVGPKPSLRDLMASIPLWASAAIIIAFLYVLVTYVQFVPQTGAGDPVLTGGRYFFNNHGTMREVSGAAFHAGRAASVRLYSAVWIYLCLISTTLLLFSVSPGSRQWAK